MKDLETKDGRPDREDTDGRPEREPAYKSFMKDKRTRITTSKSTEKVNYRRPEFAGNEFSGERSAAGSYRKESAGRGEYAAKGYRSSEQGGDYRSGEKRSYSRDYNSQGGYRNRDGNNSGSSYRSGDRMPYERKEEHTEGSEKRRSYNPNFDSGNRPLNGRRYGDRPFGEGRQGGNYTSGPGRGSERYEGRKPADTNSGSWPDRKGETYGSAGRDRNDYNRDRDGYNKTNRSYDRKPSRSRSEDGRSEEGGRGYGGGKRPYGSPRDGANSYKGSSYGKPRQEGPAKYGKPSYGKPGQRQPRQAPKYDSENYPTFPAPVIEDKIRLNRYISMSGICSRREADDFIQSGVVTVNGLTVTELGAKVSQDDEIRFNGNVIKNEKKVYIVMNKPKGYVTSVEDPHADKTVMDLLKNGCRERVYPVGRLDKNSLGVLLITNDGDMAKKLMHPSFEKKKVYQVSIDKPLTRADMDALAQGFELDDGEIHADAVSYVGDKKTEIGIEIHSGRNRIVRRMFEHLGYKVLKLDRVYFAGLTKQRLKRGEWRFLSPREVQTLRSGQYE